MTSDVGNPLPRRTFLAAAAGMIAASPFAVGAVAPEPPHSVTLRAGELTAVIGDNAAEGDHRAGYNGVWSLQHALADRSLFVPGIAGLNLEHLVTGAPLSDDNHFFEPRRAPMVLRPVDETTAELHQPATPVTGIESTTRFHLKDPNILDMTFECRPRQAVFDQGYLSLFWASYIHAPLDKSIYFLGGGEGQASGWSQLCTSYHNDQSTVRHRDDHFVAPFKPDGRDALFRNFSRLRFDQPFFYGHFDDLVWLVMFDRTAGIRLTHSPSGGGFHAARRTSNPAWDFQFLIRNPKVDAAYGFSLRTVLCQRCDRNRLLELVSQWQRESAD